FASPALAAFSVTRLKPARSVVVIRPRPTALIAVVRANRKQWKKESWGMYLVKKLEGLRAKRLLAGYACFNHRLVVPRTPCVGPGPPGRACLAGTETAAGWLRS